MNITPCCQAGRAAASTMMHAPAWDITDGLKAD